VEKLKHKVVFIVALGTLALLGPVLSSKVLAEPAYLGIPRSYYFILLVWLGFIMISGWIIQKSKW